VNTVSSNRVLLFVITKADLGGAQANVLDLIRGFYNEYEVHLACGETGALTKDVANLCIPVHIIPNLKRSIQGIGDLVCIGQCIELIQKIKPSIIHAHSSKAGIVARISGWICRVPTVFTAHGWGFSPGTPKRRGAIALVVEKLLAPISTQIICVAESDRQLALRLGVGNQKTLTTIYYGIPDVSMGLAETSKQPVRLVMVARFNEQKDQETLLKAIAQLSNPSVHLDLIGSGISLEPCQDLTHSLGIEARVSFLGDRRDVPKLLTQAQVFILSTHYEGLPISILEAMRAGLPVIATHVNGVPEEVLENKTGLLVPPRDPNSLAQGIAALIQSPILRQQMGQAGRERYQQEFSLDQMIAKMRVIYEAALNIQNPETNYQR